MSIGSFIKALEVLKEGKQILVMQDLSYNNAEYDANPMREVTTICRFSEMNFCAKFFTEPQYSFFIYEEEKPYYEMEEL